MIHDLNLPTISTGRGLHIQWDSNAGTVTGRDADRVLSHIAYAIKEGGVTTHPYPTGYSISDPLHNMAEMAAVLSSMFVHIPEAFAIAMKTIAPPAKDYISDIEPIY